MLYYTNRYRPIRGGEADIHIEYSECSNRNFRDLGSTNKLVWDIIRSAGGFRLVMIING